MMAALALSTLACAQTPMSRLSYTLPEGWTAGSDGRTLLPPGGSAGVVLVPSTPFAGSGEQWMTESWNRLLRETKLVDGPASGTQGGFLMRMGIFQQPNGARVWLMLHTLVADGRGESVIYFANDENQFRAHLPALSRMLAHASLAASAAAAEPAPSPPAGSPEHGATLASGEDVAGLYTASTSQFRLNPLGGPGSGSMEWRTEFYLLSPEGRVFRGPDLPQAPGGDISRFDYDAAQRETPTASGTYVVRGNDVVLTMGGGAEVVAARRRDDDALEIRGTTYRRSIRHKTAAPTAAGPDVAPIPASPTPAPPTSAPADERAKSVATSTWRDYEFTPPAGWRVHEKPDHLLLAHSPDPTSCVIQILPLQPSSGNLEQDANAVFDMMYPGWSYQQAGERQYALSRGVLPKGLRYCMKEAAMSTTAPDGRYHLEEGAALVIQAGLQVAIVAVRHRGGLAHNECLNNYETWRRFFNSLTLRGAPTVAPETRNAAERIIGVWSHSGGGAAGEYVFAANGHYALAGGLGSSSTSRDDRYEYLHLRSHAWSGDGTYAISGAELTLRGRGGEPQRLPFRFEQVNHGGTGWKDRVWLLKTDVHGRSEVCYEKK